MTQHAGLSERVVVVTGGVRGIGAAIVETFRDAGAHVVCLARSTPEQPHSDVRYLRCDVSSEGDVESAFAEVDRFEGRVDVVVNNAAVQHIGLVGELPLEDWNAVVGTNLTGVFLVCSQAIPRMA